MSHDREALKTHYDDDDSSRSNTCIASGGDLPSYVCSAATPIALRAGVHGLRRGGGHPCPRAAGVSLSIYGPRFRMLGNSVATERGLSNDNVVAAFAAGYTAYKSRPSAAPSPVTIPAVMEGSNKNNNSIPPATV